ncbi:RidA family protein [Pseudochryseolinea flava]|uniref:RidA family protein n=1 Tax=Pseudochryseolinea flava TaxID=2059302 RepID=A0A364XUJ6_9BACT|nr:RidA family protein [Pseudochryseolinea flava]RAV97977.1 RidA family protein [Pseudochryseolinea flava]
MSSKITFINPESFMQNPAFSHIAVTKGNGESIYIGGQNAINKDLEIVGRGDLVAQTEFILDNIEIALKATGATLDDLVKLTIFILQGQDVRKGFEGARKFLRKLKQPPVITGVIVAGLAHPDYLVEIEAFAFK